jgi:hypothetical protein
MTTPPHLGVNLKSRHPESLPSEQSGSGSLKSGMHALQIRHGRGDIARRVGAIFAGLERGEQISCRAARRQAALATDPKMQRALLIQARQEQMHADAFSAVRRLLPRSADRCPLPLSAALDAFEARLHADLDAAALGSALFGLQGVLEAMATAILRSPSGMLGVRAATLLPFRGLLLRQEEGHHRLGSYWRAQPGCEPAANSREEYLYLAEAILLAGTDIVDGFETDRQWYLSELRRSLDNVEAA